MSLDLSAVGFTTPASVFSYDWKTVVLYALGIGAKADELDYLFESRGPRVYPTFAVIPALASVTGCIARTGGDPTMIVHGAQSVVAHRPIPPEGRLMTTGTVKGIYDMKKLAQVVVETNTKLESGERVFDTVWTIFIRGAGNFKGAPPPKSESVPVPKDRPADFRVEEATTREQALLYRLSGDLNPLHIDPAFAASVGFPQGPILHGLATYGFVARAVIKAACGGDASKLQRIEGSFRKPVWPGDTIVTEGFQLASGKLALVASVKERPNPVVTAASADVAT